VLLALDVHTTGGICSIGEAVTALSLAPGEGQLLVGTQSGGLAIMSPDAGYLRDRLRRRLRVLGF
jgi:hypothetical protein